ncbi:MAG: DUF2034 domain-containing protein [Gammaproteobacteria bacterium]
MARNRQSRFEEMIELASFLPWWLCIVFAVFGYYVFHYISLIEIAPAAKFSESGSVLWKQVIVAIAYFFQFLIPFTFILGAILSAVRQWKRKSIFVRQESLATVRNLSWQAFELLISEAFRRKGYQVSETQDGPDGGIDLIISKNKRSVFVQCKHWKKNKVGVKEVRELKGIVAAKDVYNGILVTSGVFTTEALEFAHESGVELIDGDGLVKLIPNLGEIKHQAQDDIIPSCPNCGSNMIQKIAKQGKYSGNKFWGCSRYPACKGILNIKA